MNKWNAIIVHKETTQSKLLQKLHLSHDPPGQKHFMKSMGGREGVVIPSLPDCFRTPTGTMTVGGGELSTPDASACCRGGMVEQYSAGLLGFGLWLLAGAGVSHSGAAESGKK